MNEVFCLEQSTTAPVYSTVGSVTTRLSLPIAGGRGKAPRASPLASTKKYQVEWLGIFYLVKLYVCATNISPNSR